VAREARHRAVEGRAGAGALPVKTRVLR